jgi:tryptophan-rich sensory protein
MPQSSEIYAESVRGMNERQKSNLRERAERRHRREGAFSPWAALAIAGGAVLAAGLVGRRYAPDRSHPGIKDWYGSLEKPDFTPPDAVFGAVWPALELLLAAGGYRLLREASGPERNAALALWAVNLAMIPGWTKVFFGERSTTGGFAAATAQLGAGLGYVEAARRVDGPAAAMALPYAAWIAFASLTAEEVWRENRGR